MLHNIYNMYSDIKNKEETNAAFLLTRISYHKDMNKVSKTTVNSHDNHQKNFISNQEPLKCGTVIKLGSASTVNGARLCVLMSTFKGKECCALSSLHLPHYFPLKVLPICSWYHWTCDESCGTSPRQASDHIDLPSCGLSPKPLLFLFSSFSYVPLHFPLLYLHAQLLCEHTWVRNQV